MRPACPCQMLAKHCSRLMRTPIAQLRPCLPPLHQRKAAATVPLVHPARSPRRREVNLLPQPNALLELSAPRRPRLTLRNSSRPAQATRLPELPGTTPKATRFLAIHQKTNHRGSYLPAVAKGDRVHYFTMKVHSQLRVSWHDQVHEETGILVVSHRLAPVSAQPRTGPRNERL